MSYTIELVVGPLPAGSGAAWRRVEELREAYYGDEREVAPELLRLHELLTARYPCLCSYADDDPAMDDSPWADGPMVGNFAHEMGMLAVVFSRVEEVLPFVVSCAHSLGLTVADAQSGEILRPPAAEDEKKKEKPWWRFW